VQDLLASEYREFYRIAHFAFEDSVKSLFVEGADVLAIDERDLIAGV
jgi:hypothetical protein